MENRKGTVWKLLDEYLKNRVSERKGRRIIQRKFFREKVNQTEEHR